MLEMGSALSATHNVRRVTSANRSVNLVTLVLFTYNKLKTVTGTALFITNITIR